ncbi:hypothetical protein HHI36_010316 [Cryptolaemus montrouzieri]
MDYEQWKPLGRGDPLKDDPTFDYVPPVLDRVHYWIDPASRKPDSSVSENRKTEILLLGVSSKKPSTGSHSADSRKDVFDSFMKFVDGPKFHNHQRISRPQFNTDYYHPPFADRNKYSERNPYSKGNDQRIPYTILVPPPISNVKPSTSQPLPLTSFSDVVFSTKTTELPKSTVIISTSTVLPPPQETYSPSNDVSIQTSNLIYSSSSLSSSEDWNKATTEINRQKASWKTTPTTNSFPSNGNMINQNFEDIVTVQKPMPESYIQIDFSLPNLNYSHKPLLEAGSDHNINFIAAPSFGSNVEIMHKGQVSDDNLDISNTYVKIGKTEAQVHASDDVSMPIIAQSVNPPDMEKMMVFSRIKHPLKIETFSFTPLAMETMQPPPITLGPIFTPSLVNKEEIKDSNEIIPTRPTMIQSKPTVQNPETTTEFITTTSTALTTDPLFKHYKQPIEPLRGPLYLIIQGHSKVKTYGASKSIHGIAVQETNEIPYGKEENEAYEIEHLHNYPKQEDNKMFRKGRSGNLQTLKHVVQTGLGAITSSELKDPDEKNDDIQEAEVQGGFEVLTGKVTSEKYHKGIVEAARKLKDFNNSEKHD